MTASIPPEQPCHLVVMGVCGSGKSLMGQRLAQQLGLPFIEGDEHHPEANLHKMRQGIPLQDSDRQGWLERLGQLLAAHPQGAVLSCSALKLRYREQLRHHCPRLGFVYLHGDYSTIEARLLQRQGHFMPPALLASQFADLEIPHNEPRVWQLDVRDTPEQLLAQLLPQLPRSGAC
ncbi:gluconokinase [Balneatrix alpica]|uniref:gluconokinase n=1 Tax=Balneatrix alpica TaxID=75684 RepID=UPI0027387C7F|nr:gluconokinase [Balneatrix alpica]